MTFKGDGASFLGAEVSPWGKYWYLAFLPVSHGSDPGTLLTLCSSDEPVGLLAVACSQHWCVERGMDVRTEVVAGNPKNATHDSEQDLRQQLEAAGT